MTSHRLVEPIFLMRGRGELLEDFRTVGQVVVLGDLVERAGLRVARAAGRERSARALQRSVIRHWLASRTRAWGVDAVYVNTALAWPVTLAATDLSLPVIWHIHESDAALDEYVPCPVMRQAAADVDQFIAVSRPVSRALESRGVASRRIAVIPGAIPHYEEGRYRGVSRALRRRLGSADAALVVGMGKPSWTKGSDLFVQLAARMDDRPGLRMCWVGMRDDPASLRMRDEVDRAGLADRVQLIDAVADPLPYLAAADVFVSTARQDSMPLTVLEAASVGVPFVCFEGSGGAADLAGLGVGLAVGYLDVPAMAEAVDRLLSDRGAAGELAVRAQAFVAEHCSEAAVGRRVAEVVRQTVGVV